MSMGDPDAPNGERRSACAVVEQAMHAKLNDDQENAEQLLAEAHRIGFGKALEVLQDRTSPAHYTIGLQNSWAAWPLRHFILRGAYG